MNECGLKDNILSTLNNDIFKLDSILDQSEFKSQKKASLDVKNIIHSNIKNIIQNLPFEEDEIPKAELVLYSNSETKSYINTFFDFLETKFPRIDSKTIFKEENTNEIYNWNSSNAKDQIRCIKKLLVFKYTKMYTYLRNAHGEELTQRNNCFVCPYCKRNYINVIISKGNSKLVKPDLDHFYPKSLYPFLAVTLSNLIPSCLSCNQRCKGSIDTFELKPHTYPPENVFNLLKFTHNYYPIKINMEIKDNFDDFFTTKVEVKNHLDTFLIPETYKSHTEILNLIKEKNDKYSDIKKKDLLNTVAGLEKGDIQEIVFYEYERMKRNNKREPLAKLKLDLYESIVKGDK